MKIIINPEDKTVLMEHNGAGETFKKFDDMDVLLAWIKKYFDDIKIVERDSLAK